MSESTPRRLAAGIGALCLAGVVASLALLALDLPAITDPITGQFPWFLNTGGTGVLGLLIAYRRPRNPIGWLLLTISAFNAVYLPAFFLAVRGLLAGVPPSGWVEWPAWLFNWTGGFGAELLALLILFFPDGRLPGPRWRSVAWLALAGDVLTTAGAMADPSPIQLSPRLPMVPNPVGLQAMPRALTVAGQILFPAVSLTVVIVAVIARFRRAEGVERRQLQWFAYVASGAIGMTIAGLALTAVNGTVGSDVASVAFDFGIGVALPVTIGLAVVKHGLYDIDVFISRTLVYGSLAAFITAVYVAIAVGVGVLIGSGGKPDLALSILATAIVAVAFQPVRERFQKLANRVVYGERATPYEVLSEFSGRVADSYAGDEVLPRMARVLAEGTGAERAEVWLRAGSVLAPAALWPGAAEAGEPVAVTGQLLPSMPGADRAVAVHHQGELLGALTVTKRRGESLSPIEEKLLADLANQAGLVLKNVGLTADLQARLKELRASRQRLVAAQDEERRRIERNLHDGAQQHLVALKVKLGLAEALAGKDQEKAGAMLAQLKGDADEALHTLRDLARGIYPPLLADRGLVAALEAQARKATIAVAVDGDGVGRYPQEVEAAVYFCCLEALQNVQKYARASHAKVALRRSAGQLAFEVADDGQGFDPAPVPGGSGIQNMIDRLDALGGLVEIRSRPGGGTTVRGELPVQELL